MKCGSQRDLVRGCWAVLLWGLPTALVLLGAVVPTVRATLWIPSFAIMGIACLANARGCGRLHCFITGPLFLLASIVTALDAFAVMTIHWKLIVVGVGIGTLFAYSLEWLRGRYVGTTAP